MAKKEISSSELMDVSGGKITCVEEGKYSYKKGQRVEHKDVIYVFINDYTNIRKSDVVDVQAYSVVHKTTRMLGTKHLTLAQVLEG